MHVGYDGCGCAFMDSCGLLRAVFPRALGAFICASEVPELILEADLRCCAQEKHVGFISITFSQLSFSQTTDRSVFGAPAQQEETPEPWSLSPVVTEIQDSVLYCHSNAAWKEPHWVKTGQRITPINQTQFIETDKENTE